MNKWIVVLVIYSVAIVTAHWLAPGALIFLGAPWSFLVVAFGWVIIHASGGNALDWLLLLSTLPNIILILRSVLLKQVNESIKVE